MILEVVSAQNRLIWQMMELLDKGKAVSHFLD